MIAESDAVFKEGARAMRPAYGVDRGVSEPKYAGYIIYENLIILCQGVPADQFLERCSFFVSALHSSE